MDFLLSLSIKNMIAEKSKTLMLMASTSFTFNCLLLFLTDMEYPTFIMENSII